MVGREEELVPVFVPALAAVLLAAEDKKGDPLTYDEVLRFRDQSPCIMMRVEHVAKMAQTRGYADLDPENCWRDWQHLRRELGRKPDIDPGPKFNQLDSRDPEYQQTIIAARNTIEQFRALLPADGSGRWGAMIKTTIHDGENRALMWLSHVGRRGANFVGEFVEVPAAFTSYAVGDQVEVTPDTMLDWMLLDDGVLQGGFSIRYMRSKTPASQQTEYDAYIGVTRYA